MARGDHWWNEPPWWAWATMAVGLAAILVMLPFALDRESPEADPSTRAALPTTAPATQSGSAATSAEPRDGDAPRVLVVGDVDTAGFAAGSVGWPAVLERRLPDAEFTVATTGDAGYVTIGTEDDATIPDLVAAADLSEVDVVLIFDSRFDAAGIADRVEFAIGVTIGAIAEQAPGAELVVVGPPWPDDAPPAGVRNNRNVLRLAAETAGVTFVDPIAEGWLADAPQLVGPDGEHLTAEADAYLADRFEPLLRQALAA
ncbi:SGNH/GDSL hydrolase family protein [Trujillonella endophytica]|uniref:Lysophospholipase L1 n=1 Tax=Trujillonella endophytica TaxID=673521 RepID=A0A1H8W4V4_9ACTN|nr:SGNH/GDSL hydrolase family protein [Trujillella endophytica]SEP22666.1 Lysophospholipase L1 [Trujillella endophytica]